MNTINSDATMPSLESKAIEVEILPPNFSATSFSEQISDTVEKVLLAAVNNLAETSQDKFDRISTISIKTKFRLEVVPDTLEVDVSLRS